jgi:hypothetical protein
MTEQRSKLSVAMMVWNTCENDSRVIKEATTLAGAGYEVTVVCLAAPSLPKEESLQGVAYLRVSPPRLAALAAVVVGAGALVLSLLVLGWLLVSLGVTPTQAGAALLVVLALGILLRPLLRPRRLIVKAHGLITRGFLGRMRLRRVRHLEKVMAPRLVHMTMSEAVESRAPSVVHAHDLQTLPAAARLALDLQAKLVQIPLVDLALDREEVVPGSVAVVPAERATAEDVHVEVDHHSGVTAVP